MNLYRGLWSQPEAGEPSVPQDLGPPTEHSPPTSSPSSPPTERPPSPPVLHRITIPSYVQAAAALADGQGNRAPRLGPLEPRFGRTRYDDDDEDRPEPIQSRWRNASPPRAPVCDAFDFRPAPPSSSETIVLSDDEDEDEAADDRGLIADLFGGHADAGGGGGDDEEEEEAASVSPFGRDAIRSPYFGGGGGDDTERREGRRFRKRLRSGRSRFRSTAEPGMVMVGDESSAYETDGRVQRTDEPPPEEGWVRRTRARLADPETRHQRGRRRGGEGEEEEEEEEEPERAGRDNMNLGRQADRELEALRNMPPDSPPSRALVQAEDSVDRLGGDFRVYTDCCRGRNGRALPGIPLETTEPEAGEVGHGRQQVWCFGCQWGARGHRPVDNDKIRDLVDCFTNLILQGSTTLENISRIISDLYRRTIRAPSLAADQWLPDWPPAVVQRHIEGLIEPRARNMLTLRKHIALLDRLSEYAMRVDTATGEESPNLPVVRALFQGMREMRELYRQVPKESFGYNENFRAESWSGGVLVHPSRIQQASRARAFAGAPVASSVGRAGTRCAAVSSGGGDTGELRGPSNDEELVRRPITSNQASLAGIDM